MDKLNVDYDYRLDSKCGDPDTDSQRLYNVHSKLWNKELPNGNILTLSTITKNYGRLLLKANLSDNLSSDRMCPHFVGIYNGKFDDWINENEKEEIEHKVRTIGGHIVFPAHKKNGFTINQARGVNRNISDRFDLTLECIRRFYLDEESVLLNTLNRYHDFFELFGDFKAYINFFMLQDFVDDNNKTEVLHPIYL